MAKVRAVTPAAFADPSPPTDQNAALVMTRHGVVLHLNVAPNSKTTEIAGMHGGRVRIRLSATPAGGLANAALRHWLAAQLHLPQAGVTLLRGATGRNKQVLIAAEIADIERWLAHGLGLKS